MAEKFAAYKRAITLLLAIASSGSGVIVIAITLLAGNEFFVQQWLNLAPVAYVIYWLILAGMFSVLARYSWSEVGANSNRLFVQTFTIGLIVGLADALVRVALYRELWTAFNLFAEPLRTALFGMVVVWFMSHIDDRYRAPLTHY
jgi:hypothetical protein